MRSDPRGGRAGTPEPAPWYVPAGLAVAAPVSVVVALAGTGNVLVAFLVYHLGLCLTAPALVDRWRGFTWREHARRLGLAAPSREGWAAGLLTGLAMAVVVLAPFVVAGAILLGQAPLGIRLAAWGVPVDAEVPLFAYMLVFNSGAEELLWRGYLHTELTSRLGNRLGIGLASLAFASYHLFTIQSLAADWRLAVVGTLGVLSAALLWATLRRRYRSVLPALVSHGLATAGYMTVFVTFV